jgi:NADH-quinone oxidoreductase subunit K
LDLRFEGIDNRQSSIVNRQFDEVDMPSMVDAVPLSWVLIVAAALFCIGLFGALSRRNTVGILLGVELMLNAVNINLVAFWRYLEPNLVAGQIFALFIITVAAAEAAVGLAMIIAIYRARLTVNVDEVDTLKG